MSADTDNGALFSLSHCHMSQSNSHGNQPAKWNAIEKLSVSNPHLALQITDYSYFETHMLPFLLLLFLSPFSFNPALRSCPPSHLGTSSKLDCPRFGVSSPFSFLLSHFSFLKAFSTCCACVFVLICLGVKMWVIVPVSSAMKVVRRVPMYLRPHIDFSPHVPKIS